MLYTHVRVGHAAEKSSLARGRNRPYRRQRPTGAAGTGACCDHGRAAAQRAVFVLTVREAPSRVRGKRVSDHTSRRGRSRRPRIKIFERRARNRAARGLAPFEPTTEAVRRIQAFHGHAVELPCPLRALGVIAVNRRQSASEVHRRLPDLRPRAHSPRHVDRRGRIRVWPTAGPRDREAARAARAWPRGRRIGGLVCTAPGTRDRLKAPLTPESARAPVRLHRAAFNLRSTIRPPNWKLPNDRLVEVRDVKPLPSAGVSGCRRQNGRSRPRLRKGSPPARS
jgi:hypothetical protein